jgi:hypothetical protein
VISLVNCFEQLIHPDWRLPRNGSIWLLTEPKNVNKQGKNYQIELIGGPSYAFSLDQSETDPWPFIRAAELKGIRKVCDALIVIQRDEHNYVVALEMKSTNPDKAERQIASSRLLINWLIDLLKLHNHWNGNWKFCGVISFTPRNQERKGATTKKTTFPTPISNRWGFPVFRLHNHQRLDLLGLINSVDKAV